MDIVHLAPESPAFLETDASQASDAHSVEQPASRTVSEAGASSTVLIIHQSDISNLDRKMDEILLRLNAVAGIQKKKKHTHTLNKY